MPRVFVDETKCEGKKQCVRVCPEHVFAMRAPQPGHPLLVRLKHRVHGGKVAYVANEEACKACGQCESACPEKAIRVEA